jgi:hypothetical protein
MSYDETGYTQSDWTEAIHNISQNILMETSNIVRGQNFTVIADSDFVGNQRLLHRISSLEDLVELLESAVLGWKELLAMSHPYHIKGRSLTLRHHEVEDSSHDEVPDDENDVSFPANGLEGNGPGELIKHTTSVDS